MHQITSELPYTYRPKVLQYILTPQVCICFALRPAVFAENRKCIERPQNYFGHLKVKIKLYTLQLVLLGPKFRSMDGTFQDVAH